MASLARSSMLRQPKLSTLSKLTLPSNSASTVRGLSYCCAKSNFLATPFSRDQSRQSKIEAYRQKAAFHVSATRSILPPLPQRIDGTANDPAPVPEPSPTHGSYHWTFERLLAAGLIPLTVAPFAVGSLNPVMDALLCGSIIIHSHLGFQACIIDYFPIKRVPKIRATLWWVLRGATVLVGVGLYEFETNDVGVTEAIKKIWMS